MKTFSRNLAVEVGSATVPVAPVGVSPTGPPPAHGSPNGAFIRRREVFGATPKTAGETPRAPQRATWFRFRQLAGWLIIALAGAWPGEALAAGGFSFDTSFTHQGRLRFDGKPANGLYDFQFKLYTNLVGGGQLGLTTNYTNILASNGLYRIDLDFGDVFQGGARYIETAVQSATNRIGFQTLSPRQPVTSVPYAQWARRGGSQVWRLSDNVGHSIFSIDNEGRLYGGTEVLADWVTLERFVVFALPSYSKKVEAIRILVTDRFNNEGGNLLLQAEIRSITGSLREVLSVTPINTFTVPLEQWQTFTLDPARAAVVRPGEYLCLRGIATGLPLYGSIAAVLFGEATVCDAE